MAAVITQNPNLTTSAYTPMVYVLTGLTTEDRYVLRVNIAGVGVATFKQPANPAGVGIFDISKVIQSYLAPEPVETTQFFTDSIGAYVSYQVEAWLETGQTQGTIATDITRFAINAYDNWRSLGGDLTPFIPTPTTRVCETNSNLNAVYSQPYRFLTNYPGEYSVRRDEYNTLSFFAKVDGGGANLGPNEAPFFCLISFYTAGILQVQVPFTIAQLYGSTLRTNCQDMTVTLNDDNAITTLGTGVQNFTDAGINMAPYDKYVIDIKSYNHCMTTTIQDCQDYGEILIDGYLGDTIYTATFNIDDTCEKFEPITVSFMNQYGVQDYYTFDKRNTRRVQTKRNEYTQSPDSWSSSTFTINQTGRGRTVFSSASNTEMTLSTNWMDDATSEWLQELFASPSTLIYVNNQWEPVVITTATYEQKTYARNQLFQHELTVRFANNQKLQRG